MAVVKINALQIPPQAGDEIVKRFAARLEELSAVEGFESFELLRPTGETETRWFVYSRWADEAAYQAWRNSDTFAKGHAGPGGGDEGGADGEAGAGEPRRPVATGSSLLEFEVAIDAAPASAD